MFKLLKVSKTKSRFIKKKCLRRLKYLICRIAGYTSSINQIENKIFHSIARKFQNKCSKLFKLWHILMTSLIHNTPYSCCITMNERLAYTRTRGIPRAYTIVHSLSVKRLECFKYDDIDTTYLIEDLYFVLFLYLTNIEIVFFCILIKKGDTHPRISCFVCVSRN